MKKIIAAAMATAAITTGVTVYDSASASTTNCKEIAVRQIVEKHLSYFRNVTVYVHHCRGEYRVVFVSGVWTPNDQPLPPPNQ